MTLLRVVVPFGWFVEMKEFEVLRGTRLEVFLEIFVLLLFVAITAGMRALRSICVVFWPGGVVLRLPSESTSTTLATLGSLVVDLA